MLGRYLQRSRPNVKTWKSSRRWGRSLKNWKLCKSADIGPVFPNPVYKISDFLMDVKTIIKFIKDLITSIIGIINNVNKLARIMLNGINSLKEILDEFLNIIGLKWLMNLVQNIINLFGNNIKSVRLSGSCADSVLLELRWRRKGNCKNTLQLFT